jgi:signal transduction histidine kinase
MDSSKTQPIKKQHRRLEPFLDISRKLSASSDLEPFLHSLLSTASEQTDCELASILELDHGKDHLHYLALPWFYQDALKAVKVPLRSSIAGWVFQNGKPALIPDVSVEHRHFKGAYPIADFTTRSLMAVPIIFRGETLGVLEVVNKTKQTHYTEEDLTILEALASQAAVAIQNARLIDQVQHSQDQMAQLGKMKSNFIAITSHELRTPLGLILGYATFLRDSVQPDYCSQVDIIIQNAMRLKEIIDDVANMDNLQRGVASVHPGLISIKKLVKEVMEAYKLKAQEKRLTLHSNTGQRDLLVEGDSSKVAIALSNMVENAITFTNPGGNIYLQAEAIPGYVKVSVIDDGIGIPSKDLPHIFERFYQVESHLTRKHGGMGLGLSIAKVMIELHGGRIWAESVEGKGSRFTFILPGNNT